MAIDPVPRPAHLRRAEQKAMDGWKREKTFAFVEVDVDGNELFRVSTNGGCLATVALLINDQVVLKTSYQVIVIGFGL